MCHCDKKLFIAPSARGSAIGNNIFVESLLESDINRSGFVMCSRYNYKYYCLESEVEASEDSFLISSCSQM